MRNFVSAKEVEKLKAQLEAEKRKRSKLVDGYGELQEEIIRLRGYFGEQIAALEAQLMHERSEREAAQRTIARLGGGE